MGHLKWFRLPTDVSPAVIVGENVCGIYILQFTTGERYVGQAVNIAKRISQHRHGGKHHAAWNDIEAFSFYPVEKTELNRCERETIENQKCFGHRLRNVTFNLQTTTPRPIDSLLGLTLESHWATGQERYLCAGELALPQPRSNRKPKLFTQKAAQQLLPDGRSMAEAVVDDLAFAVMNLIPNASDLEGEYWSISDCPSSVGGRFATLNVGNLELMYFPSNAYFSYPSRQNRSIYNSHLNVVEEAFSPLWCLPGSTFSERFHHPKEHFALRNVSYPKAQTTQIIVPSGELAALPTSTLHVVIEQARKLPLLLMRNTRNTLFNRFHSVPLTDMVYQRIQQLMN